MEQVIKKLTLRELRALPTDTWTTAIIVFSNDSYAQEYSLESRSYRVHSDAKYFNPQMIGTSLYGTAIDGTDPLARLDWALEYNGWIVEYCYIER